MVYRILLAEVFAVNKKGKGKLNLDVIRSVLGSNLVISARETVLHGQPRARISTSLQTFILIVGT